MSSKATACPSCGTEIVGKFCVGCGKKIRRTCSSCGANASAGARYCQQCGASLTGTARAKGIAPSIIAGAVGAVVALVGAFLFLGLEDDGASSTIPTASTTTPTVTPVQAAEQLYNRVMAASERGDTAEARRFAPMVLDAYGQLGTLDNDEHYHVGRIHLIMGDTTRAQAELDAIRPSEPDHLLGIMLEHSIAEARGDDEGVAEAYARFLSTYDAEILIDRDEYRTHRVGIDGFRDRARVATR